MKIKQLAVGGVSSAVAGRCLPQGGKRDDARMGLGAAVCVVRCVVRCGLLFYSSDEFHAFPYGFLVHRDEMVMTFGQCLPQAFEHVFDGNNGVELE